MKNKSYIGISFIILIFGIYAVPRIIDRIKDDKVIQNDRMSVGETTSDTSGMLVIRKAPKFELTNQDNKKISNADYKGKVYVLEFFFSTCPSICPVMNKHMMEIQTAFLDKTDFGIASITINPENDTPEVLKKHAAQLGVTSPNWHFLTGDKAYIYKIANNGFNIFAGENKAVEGGFEHSGLFALIDKNGNIRSRRDEHGNPIMYYDGLDKKGISALKEDIKILLLE